MPAVASDGDAGLLEMRMSEEKLQLEARLVAIEYLLQRVCAMQYSALNLSLDHVKKLHAANVEQMHSSPIATSDPALSMLGASAVAENLERILHGVEETMAFYAKQSGKG
jgi:hypothetical protein